MRLFNKMSLGIFFMCALISSATLHAQNQGLYVDTIKWPNSNTITVNIKSTGFSNVLNFQGTIKWNTNSLQWVSHSGNASLGSSNFSFGSTSVSQGILTYVFADATNNHTVSNGTTIMSIIFNVINNPVSTYNNNLIRFDNSPTFIGIDTAADIAGLSDYGSLYSPNLERHISAEISFARPPLLSYAGNNITDSVTNRPIDCTYQWFVGGNPVAGPNSSTYNNSPNGVFTLQVTYPNGTQVSSLNSVISTNFALPIGLSSFTGSCQNSIVNLNWKCTDERNLDFFEVMKSDDGIIFSSIGKLASVGENEIHEFSYPLNDNKIINNYFRLKMVDKEGSESFSETIRIICEDKSVENSRISIYPTISSDYIHITSASEKIVGIELLNDLGNLVFKQNIQNTNTYQLDLSNTTISVGYYFLKVKGANHVETFKIIKE